jgi:very-short-patch-repair endonuclease
VPRYYVKRDGERDRQTGRRNVKVYVPQWVDPYWWIMGSEPEKMVLAELVRRGIYFQHVPQKNSIGKFVDPTWEADFMFPQFKIWLEINGLYFHTLKGQIESDALRYARIEASGWRLLVWWDYDIEARLQDLFNAVPEFYVVNPANNEPRETTGDLPFYTGGLEVDHLEGLRKALSKRARTPQFQYRVRLPGDRRPK